MELSPECRLRAKFFNVSQKEEPLPIGECRILEPDAPYLISKMERKGLSGYYVVVYLVCRQGYRDECWLPEHYAAVVTDEDIGDVNSGRVRLVLRKRRRRDMPDGYDLVID